MGFLDDLLAGVGVDDPPTPDERKKKVFEYLTSYCSTHPYGPTVREICAAVGGSTSTIHSILNSLRDEKKIDWVDGQARTLHLTNV